MEEKLAEFAIGRRHLANMMGEDPNTFTQEDINVSNHCWVIMMGEDQNIFTQKEYPLPCQDDGRGPQDLYSCKWTVMWVPIDMSRWWERSQQFYNSIH